LPNSKRLALDRKMKKTLLTGNEAIARGAYEAGARVAVAYPGTPSTEILENIAKYEEIYSQWSVNEKVAMEVASGSSIAGARTIVAMKHVGLNVAADPFMTLSYTGVNAGLVIIVADDPHMHSSQNEQDSRYYARFAKIPMLEPSDSDEAIDFVKKAFDISERFDCPVLVRSSTRLSHSRSVAKTGKRKEVPLKKYEKDSKKFVMIPAYGRLGHERILNRWEKLKDLSSSFKGDKVFNPEGPPLDEKTGVVTSGVSFQYAREVFRDLPVLKLSLTNPFSIDKIKGFAEGKERLLVIEELEPYLEEEIRKSDLDIEIIGKQVIPQKGELGTEVLQDIRSRIFGGKSRKKTRIKKTGGYLPARPPVLCAGCPHRPVFYLLKKLKVAVMGDIGCYTLSVLPPLNALDSCLCMGAGIGQALGMEKADPGLEGKVVSVIGDSTFFHSGMTPLVDSAYNNGTGLIIILDNRTTAMTGHQVHPGVGLTLKQDNTSVIKPESMARAAGIKNIRVIDPYDLEGLRKALKEELGKKELSVIIARRECVLLDRVNSKEVYHIDDQKCIKCGNCLDLGCPAIELFEGTYRINPILCVSCGLCEKVCRKGAIAKK